MSATYTADTKITVFGNKRVSYGTVTMTSVTSGAVETGLNNVLFASVAFAKTYTTATVPIMCACNVGSGGTAIAGMVHIASCTANDVLKLFAFGE